MILETVAVVVPASEKEVEAVFAIVTGPVGTVSDVVSGAVIGASLYSNPAVDLEAGVIFGVYPL